VTRNSFFIASLIITLGICNIAFGSMFQLIPLAMDAEGHSKFLVGMNTMMGQAGVLITSLNLTRLRQRFRSHNLVMAGIGIALFCFVGFSFTSPVWSWFAIRFISGFGMATIFTTAESWIQSRTNDASRGRVMGAYMTSQTLTFGIGPLIIPYTGVTGATPWFLAIGALTVGLIAMSRIHYEDTHKHEAIAPLVPTLAKGPFIFLCIFATTVFEAFMLNFFSLYAISNGLDQGQASQILSIGIIGCVLFFFAIGYLADHWSRMGMAIICAGVALVFSLLQAPLINTLWIWPVVVLVRAGAFGAYLTAFGFLGSRFKGAELIAAGSISALLWGVSGVIAPPFAGYLFDTIGIWLLPYLMAACFVPILIAALFSLQRKAVVR
jgi:MFS family permease